MCGAVAAVVVLLGFFCLVGFVTWCDMKRYS